MSDHFLDELNESQRKAVEATEGAVMVIAGAGSGKTRVLTFRVAHLMSKGVDPFNILCLTFTNKAAREMKDRITNIIGNTEGKNIWMGTFHSIFAKILRVEGGRLGYSSNYTIYDTADSKNLIKSLVKEFNLDEKTYAASNVLSRISGAKANLISWQEYQKNEDIRNEDHSMRRPFIGQIYEAYQKRCFKASAMDFDDILFNMYILLRDHAEVLHKYQKIFKYILVDEYQDTNYAQYLIIKSLAARTENICVVGDDAQSIYGFRGANIQNILGYQKDYPDCRIFKLEQNYRSTSNIVNAANSVIANNKAQIHKVVWTKNEEGDRIRVVRTHTDQEEGLAVAHNIFETKMNLQLPNSDFAILYRTNAQSRAFEESLRRLNIPYRIYGGMSFYQRKEIKDLLAYFRLVINPDDEEALMRIINYPARGIGKTTLEKLVILSNDNNVSIWKLLENVSSLGSILNSGTKEKISAFLQTMKSFQAMLKKKDAYELAHHIAQTTGILRELRDDKTPEGVSRYENIEELLNAIKDFVENDEVKESPSGQEIPDEKTERTLDFFMQDIALLTDADDKKNNADTDRVSLMTVHAAKGLEFPFVHIVGLEENLFPSAMAIQTRNELEEERRLFYVALTRAKTRAMLSYSLSRYKWGNLQYCEPSRFIEEISPECVELPGAEPARTPKSMQTSWKPSFTAAKPDAPARKPVQPAGKLVKLKTAEKMTAGNSELSGLEPGTVVEHQRFGRGKVISIEGNNESLKATVNFENAGSKQLLLKFAKLTIIG